MTRAIAALLWRRSSLARPAPADAYLKFGFRVGATTVDVKWPGVPIRYSSTIGIFRA